MTDTPQATTEEGTAGTDGLQAGAQETVPPSPVPPSQATGGTGTAGGGTADGEQSEPVAGAPYETPEEMAARIKELTADLQRLQAEYLNYKRRVDRDRDLVSQNARSAVLSGLLPVLDDVDRAREHEELTGGFKAVAESLERIVAGEGLLRFGAPGDEFDPRIHEALMHSLSSEVSTTTCDKIVQAGYRLGDRVVRPALVTVVDPDPSAAPEAGGPPASGNGDAGTQHQE